MRYQIWFAGAFFTFHTSCSGPLETSAQRTERGQDATSEAGSQSDRSGDPAGAAANPGTPAPLPSSSPTPSPMPAIDLGERLNLNSPMGTNLNDINDWSSEYSFVDAFKTSRNWISGNSSSWDDGRPFDLDEHGWVKSLADGQIARTAMFWGGNKLWPSGKYTVLYEGQGVLNYWAGAKKNIAESSPGKDIVDVDPQNGGLGINITATTPGNHLRNIRVIMPGGSCSNDQTRSCRADTDCQQSQCVSFTESYSTRKFHPEFLKKIKNYRVLRFMNWMSTNGSQQKVFSERPKMSDARWSVKGAPLEIMIELANLMRMDPWFCMPHMAEDSYMEDFAQFVKASLNPELKSYIEYSNEVWNSQFVANSYAADQGVAAGYSTVRHEAALYYYSKRTVDMFDVWMKVFGDKSRLVRVMASQSANPWVAKTQLNFRDAFKKTDALAIAPYFTHYDLIMPGKFTQAQIDAFTPKALLNDLRTTWLPKVLKNISDHRDLLRNELKTEIELIAYEGGQHLAGVYELANNKTLEKLFHDTNRDPGMKDLYLEYLAGWKANGGKMFVHFMNCGEWSKWGSWGALEHLFQDRSTSPKYDAIMTFTEQNPFPWR